MLRLISLILVLAGVSAMAFGWMRLQDHDSAERVERANDVPIAERSIAADTPSAPIVSELEIGDTGISLSDSSSGSRTRSASAGAPLRSLSVGGDDMLSIASTPTARSPEQVFLDSLQTVPIAHETPSSAQFGRAFEVTVAIDATGDDSAADALPGEGNIVEATAQVSKDIEAVLSGDAFDIEYVTPRIQTVSPLTENVWRWKVTPVIAGSHDLTIELFALNENRAMPVRTFRDKVEVHVSRIGQAIAVANSLSPLAVVIGGLGSLLAGLLGVFRFFRGR